MRQTFALRPPLVVPRANALCRLLPAPAAQRPFPALSLRIFPCVPGPLPRRLPWCMCPLLPTRRRPSRSCEPVGANNTHTAISVWNAISGLQSFAYVQAHSFARHPDCSYRGAKAPGSRGFYVRAPHGSLPPRAPDMLIVRFGQLTIGGLSPPEIPSLAGCSHNRRIYPAPGHRRALSCGADSPRSWALYAISVRRLAPLHLGFLQTIPRGLALALG